MNEVIQFAILGLGVGSVYALAAQGLVLIYRGSGVLNFAQGAIGIAGAYVWWELHWVHGHSFAIAFIAGVAFSALIGAMTHMFLMRPMRHASSLARLVATLGVLIVIQSIAVLKYEGAVELVQSSLPTKPVVLFSDVVISQDRFILLAIACAITALLWFAYRYTRFGLSTSAVAENMQSAGAVGLSPDTIATANWALGSALAGVAAILVVPIIGIGTGQLTTLILIALAAALVGRFKSFPITLAAALTIGVVEAELTRFASDILGWFGIGQGYGVGVAQSVSFFVIAIMLVVSGRGLPLRDYLLERLPAVGSGKVRWWIVVPAVAAGFWLINRSSDSWAGYLANYVIVAIMILSLIVIVGFAGQVSLAQYALAGIGSLIAARLIATQDFSMPLAMLVAVVGTMLIGVLFAIPAVRTRGVNLAIITFGLGYAVQSMIFYNGEYTGGFFGTVIGPQKFFGLDLSFASNPQSYGMFALAFFVIFALGVVNLRRGRSGRRLLAVRNNERAAAALGISVSGAKIYAFALAAGIAAVGGILISFRAETVIYTVDFLAIQSIFVVAFAVIGGVGYVAGALIGAFLAPDTPFSKILDDLFNGSEYLPLIGGVLLLVNLIFNQNGAANTFARQWARPLDAVERAFGSLWRRVRGGKGTVATASENPSADDGSTETEPQQAATKKNGSNDIVRVPEAVLDVANMRLQYSGVVAVDDLSVTVKTGEVIGLIGPNGAGKTSAMDGITGLTKVTGTISYNGKPIDKCSVSVRARAGVSRSFQSLELFEDMTVLENLQAASDERHLRNYLFDLIYPKTRPLPDYVMAAVEEFDLIDDLNKSVTDLPYSKRRLLAIARAVATRPSILLLDEPASGLSDHESDELAELVRLLADKWGMGVLLVEHDVSLVMKICDRICVLDFGRMICMGTPAEVRANPAVIAAYLGEPA